MVTYQSIIQEIKMRYPRFSNFGEMLFYSYTNLQILCADYPQSNYLCKKTTKYENTFF